MKNFLRFYYYIQSPLSQANDIDDFVLRAFKNCWFNGTKKAEEYKMVTLKDVRLLTSWIQNEAARYCVNNKLRTPLGKAQETIVKIENIIKDYARILALKDDFKVKSYRNVLANQRNARILLGFMESLEKAIYNASEGNAFGIPSPEKPAKTFFRLNYATCNEWFTRNRLAIHLISLHCMELEMVIRCSTSVLKDMVNAGKQNEPYFDQILVSLVWAFLRNFESDALFGLYTWVKHVTGRKLLWIKMVAEQACGHREIAADGYNKILRDEKMNNSQIYDFLNDQRKICLMYSANFEELFNILHEEESRGLKPENIPVLTCSAKQVSYYIQYEKTKDKTIFDDLASWDSWETLEYGSEVPCNFSVHKLKSLAENTLSLGFVKDTQDSYHQELHEATQDIFHSLLQECLRKHSQEYLIYMNLLNHLSYACVTRHQLGGIKNIETFEIKKKFGALTMYMVSSWSEYFDDYSVKGE
jgi:serine/threonine-protein kinase SMG1